MSLVQLSLLDWEVRRSAARTAGPIRMMDRAAAVGSAVWVRRSAPLLAWISLKPCEWPELYWFARHHESRLGKHLVQCVAYLEDVGAIKAETVGGKVTWRANESK